MILVGTVRDPETDQPLPTSGSGPIVHELVIEDLKERLAFGVRKYNEPLRAFNGRDALRDAYEEALDGVTYLKQAVIEVEAQRKLHAALLEESAWYEELGLRVRAELDSRPKDWVQVKAHWPALVSLVHELTDS